MNHYSVPQNRITVPEPVGQHAYQELDFLTGLYQVYRLQQDAISDELSPLSDILVETECTRGAQI